MELAMLSFKLFFCQPWTFLDSNYPREMRLRMQMFNAVRVDNTELSDLWLLREELVHENDS